MTGRAVVDPLFEFEAFGVAVGSALVCGAVSAVVPLLVAPTATLAALALAGWVSRVRRRGISSWRGVGLRSAVALGVLGAASVLFLDPPSVVVPLRGLALAGSLLPLFVTERLRSASAPPTFSRA